ncbi:MAG TPA: hypothetical protein VFU76_04390 [Terriglobales bacterium]|nr:hypothetical protein [Terriglobales bacterium]
MNEETLTQLTASAAQLASAAEALRDAVAHLDQQHAALDAKVDRIIAAVDESAQAGVLQLQERVAGLERANAELKAQATRAGRKTLSSLATALLAKHGLDGEFDSAALDRALASLAPEQRIAVKAEMARAGIIE